MERQAGRVTGWPRTARGLNNMDLDEIVMKLVGPVMAVGDSGVDADRLKNIKALTTLVDRLLVVIHEASTDADRQEASMKSIGRHARDFLNEVAK